MKNYLKSLLNKVKNSYKYHKELSFYTHEQSKFLLINFFRLIWYIILEELSYLLNLKLRIMNELEVRQLIEKSQKYLGNVIEVEILDDVHFGKKKKITGLITETKTLLISENGINNILPYGKLTDLLDNTKYDPVPLFEIVRKFELQEKNTK